MVDNALVRSMIGTVREGTHGEVSVRSLKSQ